MRAILLHNVRSAHNVGAIFRSADGAGVDLVLLTGYTPIPVDKYGRKESRIAKTALGAEDVVGWEYHKNPLPLIRRYTTNGWCVVAIEQDEHALDYRSFQESTDTLYVVGNEVRGMSNALKRACSTVIEIPMRGKKESLNVSVAASVVLFAHARP